MMNAPGIITEDKLGGDTEANSSDNDRRRNTGGI
jgi:hypothetical protein